MSFTVDASRALRGQHKQHDFELYPRGFESRGPAVVFLSGQKAGKLKEGLQFRIGSHILVLSRNCMVTLPHARKHMRFGCVWPTMADHLIVSGLKPKANVMNLLALSS